MLGRLILLLTIVPMAELFVMLTVHRALSEQFGWKTALAVSVGTILVTGVIGVALARFQGGAAVRELQASLRRGAFPGRELLDAVLILAGGVLLLAPGYLTDLLGFSLLVPTTRSLYRRAFHRWLRARVERGEARVSARAGPASDLDPDRSSAGPVIIEETFEPEPRSGDAPNA